jgi:hypothetical protein
MKMRRSLLGAGFAALGRWRLIFLLTATAAVLGAGAASPLGPVLREEIGSRLAGDHFLRNDPAQAPADAFDFLREKWSDVTGWGRASLFAALAGVLLQIFFTGGIVESVGVPASSPGDFWSASRRHFAHNAKCFALAAILGAILLGIWVSVVGAAGKSLFENVPPHATARSLWTAVSFLVSALLLAAIALFGALAKAARRGAPAIGALAGFRDARRRLRGYWAHGLGILIFWCLGGLVALAILFGAAWRQQTPTSASVVVNLLLLALSLAAIPAAKVGAWGSLLELYDRREEEAREALRAAQRREEALAIPTAPAPTEDRGPRTEDPADETPESDSGPTSF